MDNVLDLGLALIGVALLLLVVIPACRGVQADWHHTLICMAIDMLAVGLVAAELLS